MTFKQLLAVFIELLPRRQLYRLPSLKEAGFYERLFTPIVTLWYLVFQTLRSDHTLDAVLTDALAGGANALCKNLSKKLRSTRTASYSDARKRLPLAFLLDVLALQARRILKLNPKALWRGLQVALLDGSTLRLRPFGNIPKKFPPHRNQCQRPAYWCLMRLVVCFCACTGVALACAMGPTSLSEQALACQMITQAGMLYIGDRNFGVFRIVQTIRHAGSQALVRLTDSRAGKLLGRRLKLGTYSVLWSPSAHDQLQPGCPQDPIPGQLLIVEIKRKGFRTQRLCLFTTLEVGEQYPLEELISLYGVRWHIELNLRYLKTQMQLVQLECKSAEMAKKQWVAGLIAYNLIRAAMLCAALRQDICPLSLSFSTARRHLQNWLKCFGVDPKEAVRGWKNLLVLIGKSRLPRRTKPRPSEPRAQRHLRLAYAPLNGSRKAARQKLKKSNLKS